MSEHEVRQLHQQLSEAKMIHWVMNILPQKQQSGLIDLKATSTRAETCQGDQI